MSGVVFMSPYTLRIQVCPKEGMKTTLHSYSFRMGLEASIQLDPGGVWILRDSYKWGELTSIIGLIIIYIYING